MEEITKQIFSWVAGAAISLLLFHLVWTMVFTPLFALPKLTPEQTIAIGLILRTLFTFSP